MDPAGGKIYHCPDEAKLTFKKEGKTWYFKFTMTDYGELDAYGMTQYSAPAKNGTSNKVTIEWKGSATKCTGTDFTNDYTDY